MGLMDMGFRRKKASRACIVFATPGALDGGGGIGRMTGYIVDAFRNNPAAPDTVVLDMVYQPRETRLLRDAAAAGARTVPGVDMFLAQAAAQVQLFTGGRIEVEVLRGFLAGTAAATPQPRVPGDGG